MGKLVFGDEAALRELNTITHRFVVNAVQEQLERSRGRCPFAAIDAIGLFESGLSRLCTVTVAVLAPEQARITRLMAREGISRDYALLRLRAQKKDEQFAAECGEILQNDCAAKEVFLQRCHAWLFRIRKTNY